MVGDGVSLAFDHIRPCMIISDRRPNARGETSRQHTVCVAEAARRRCRGGQEARTSSASSRATRAVSTAVAPSCRETVGRDGAPVRREAGSDARTFRRSRACLNTIFDCRGSSTPRASDSAPTISARADMASGSQSPPFRANSRFANAPIKRLRPAPTHSRAAGSRRGRSAASEASGQLESRASLCLTDR